MSQPAGKLWSLDGILRDTLLITAEPALRTVSTLPSPRINMDMDGWGERPVAERSIWEWDAEGLNQIRNLAVRHRMLKYQPVTVCNRIEWEPVTVVSNKGNTYKLPFTDEFLLSTYFLKDYGDVPDASAGLWQIPANLHSSYQRIFGYEVHPKTGKLRPIARGALGHPELMAPYDNRKPFERKTVNHGDVVDVVLLRFIVCIALGCAAERSNFEPAGVLSAARLYPHTMVLANMPLESMEASIVLERPTSRAPDPDHPEACHMVKGESMHDDVTAGFYTDRNNPSLLPPLPPSWENIFEYYDTAPQLNQPFKVVDAARPRRERANANDIFSGILDTRPDTVVFDYRARSVVKVARQGEFDNLHLAPKMRAPMEMIENHPAFAQSMNNVSMAPFCIHDCMHTHWRWGDTGILGDKKFLRGWGGTADNIGDPNQVEGAPMVPPNQDVTVTLLTPSSFRYTAKAKRPEAGAWQVVMHHGSAYSLTLSGKLAADGVALLGGALRDFSGWGRGTPWSILYWNMRYAAFREQFAERIRLSVTRLNELRAL